MNGGEVSRRLRARPSLAGYDISLDTAVGWIPLAEGGVEAAPGLIWVAAAAGPFRNIPFNFNRTQGYVIETSDALFRFYTNDEQIMDGASPYEVAHPFSYAEVLDLQYEQSFDVLYLYHGEHKPRELVRTGADEFALETHAIKNGPFESVNDDETLTITASGVAKGASVTLTASSAIFESGDIGGLFKLENRDFSEFPSWEPGITTTNGALLAWEGRIYQVVSVGSDLRTGTVPPEHYESIEWDGIGSGKDINDNDAGGVQLEYLHDRVGMLEITGFTSDTVVTATVTRRLPFPVSGSKVTDLWAFGAFSPRRGYPQAGMLWGGRHLLAKDSTIYGSVVGDLTNHAEYNELGEITDDMAFVATLPDANRIETMVAASRPVIMTASSSYTLGQTNQARALGPGNVRAEEVNSTGAATTMATRLDGRTIYIQRSRQRLIEAEYDAARDSQIPIDLTRYARHIGNRRFVEIAAMQDPERMIWSVLATGELAGAAYLPEEQLLGWFPRELAEGMAARSICVINEPAGEQQQLWVAVEYGGGWHQMRMEQIRGDADFQPTPVMVDMALIYEGVAATDFGPFALFANKAVQVVADGHYLGEIECDGSGQFSIAPGAERVVAGFGYPALLRTLPVSGGGDNGPAHGKNKSIKRIMLDLLNSKGLRVKAESGAVDHDIDQTLGGDISSEPRAPITGIRLWDDAGGTDRNGRITVERVAPFNSTIRGIGLTVDVQQT